MQENKVVISKSFRVYASEKNGAEDLIRAFQVTVSQLSDLGDSMGVTLHWPTMEVEREEVEYVTNYEKYRLDYSQYGVRVEGTKK